MIKAIIYESKTGHTEQYAKLLGNKLDLPYYTIKQAKNKLKTNDDIIFLSWIFASKISKLSTIKKKFNIICCGGVGMTPYSDDYVLELKKNNVIDNLFYLPGGIDLEKVKGIKKKMLQMVQKSLEQENKEKNKEMIKIFKEGINMVSLDYLKDLINYIKKELI